MALDTRLRDILGMAVAVHRAQRGDAYGQLLRATFRLIPRGTAKRSVELSVMKSPISARIDSSLLTERYLISTLRSLTKWHLVSKGPEFESFV
jgi:hypothetical protein